MIEQKNKQRKVYFEGVYYSKDTKGVESLRDKAPHLYAQLFPLTISNTIDNRKIQVYQVYYDEQSKEALKYGFIPYFQETTPHNFENDIILDIWAKRNWIKAKYVGVLSWRLYEKTLLEKVKLSGDVVILNCKGYEIHEHPFSRKCFVSVNQMVKLADEHKLFPFKLYHIKTITCVGVIIGYALQKCLMITALIIYQRLLSSSRQPTYTMQKKNIEAKCTTQ